MDITKVSCNSCGASLDIAPGARFVTCRYCAASLEVKRTDSAVFTEVLTRIDKRTATMAEDLGAIRREQELERLDREWELRRQSLLVRGKHGSTSEPSTFGGIFVIAFGLIAGIAWMAFAASMHGSGAFPLFGLLFIGAAVASGVTMLSKASRLDSERREYEIRRNQLLRDNAHRDDVQHNP
jgi:hypothetical protein